MCSTAPDGSQVSEARPSDRKALTFAVAEAAAQAESLKRALNEAEAAIRSFRDLLDCLHSILIRAGTSWPGGWSSHEVQAIRDRATRLAGS